MCTVVSFFFKPVNYEEISKTVSQTLISRWVSNQKIYFKCSPTFNLKVHLCKSMKIISSSCSIVKCICIWIDRFCRNGYKTLYKIKNKDLLWPVTIFIDLHGNQSCHCSLSFQFDFADLPFAAAVDFKIGPLKHLVDV